MYVSVCWSLSESTAVSVVYLSQAWHLNLGGQLQADVKLCEVLLISEWLTGSVHTVQNTNTHGGKENLCTIHNNLPLVCKAKTLWFNANGFHANYTDYCNYVLWQSPTNHLRHKRNTNLIKIEKLAVTKVYSHNFMSDVYFEQSSSPGQVEPRGRCNIKPLREQVEGKQS